MLLDFNDCAYEGSSGPSFEKRHGLRQEKPVEAHLYPDLRADDPSDELEITAVSLSRHGVGLELTHDVPVGYVYNIEIGLGGQTVHSQVRILSCDPIADGLYRAGGEFC